jgi:hypothetical protein
MPLREWHLASHPRDHGDPSLRDDDVNAAAIAGEIVTRRYRGGAFSARRARGLAARRVAAGLRPDRRDRPRGDRVQPGARALYATGAHSDGRAGAQRALAACPDDGRFPASRARVAAWLRGRPRGGR